MSIEVEMPHFRHALDAIAEHLENLDKKCGELPTEECE